MEFRCNISLRTELLVLSVLLVVQVPRIFASGLPIQSRFCGADHISYLSDSGHEFFYLNERLVDKDLFCKVLKYYHENHCFITGYNGNHLCGLDLSSDDLPLDGGRKFLHKHVREESPRYNFLENIQPSEDGDAHESLLTPKMLTIAIPGFFVLCCSLLCPCFQPKRKTEHTVISKDPVSMDSASSLVMNSVHEKIPGSPLRVPPSPSRFSMSPKLDRLGSIHLNMSQVIRATHNFSPSMMLGEGGFGTVYKAQLPDGQVVAIKRAKKEFFETLRTEFSSEVELLAKIDHRNLVKLLGYLDKGNERLIITEYVPNGTLREHLDGMRNKILDFNQRLEISIDVAHALTYLHLYAEKQIIHRDVKSSNILLTESMRAKVADFGFARLGSIDSDKTHISTKVKGTVGYLDPEYMRTYQLTPKSDVYSFGILLTEILTGRRPVELKKPPEERVTLRWVFKKFDEGNVRDMVDPLMQEVLDEEILMKMFELAFQCAAPTRNDRPDMKAVGEQLWVIRMDYLRRGRRG
ncbi:Calmodulin-binding receptor-like cytoplasmic kinase 3 [Actinidia chinensis var. chinensis]|uniref:non-specific serine/threonine protein kinase n=1 Tax=Actinidia chinensis var. chinensis TaxID=1590841 RepID=A0A2R6QIK0_ACTCC|nr:Calmodulin-binding receptor-like cytoplasmic kinase 3 [Actinidia chinensis var. chinensis]